MGRQGRRKPEKPNSHFSKSTLLLAWTGPEWSRVANWVKQQQRREVDNIAVHLF